MNLLVARWEAQGEGIIREYGMDMYTLLYLKWMTNRDMLCSTGALLMLRGSLDGRGVWGRMDTCVCMAESFSCPLETITTLLISYTPIQNKKFKKKKKLPDTQE